MSYYYRYSVGGTEYGVALAIPEEDENSILHLIALEDSIPKMLERLGVDAPDRVWLEDMDGNFVKEVPVVGGEDMVE